MSLFNLRDYQVEAVMFLCLNPRSMVVAPAGSGKTFIAAYAAAKMAKRGYKIGWLANTVEQCQQAEKAIQAVEGPEDCDFKICCAAAEPDFSDRDLVVIDECHHMPAVSWLRALTGFKGVLWGFSATPDSSDPERNQIMETIFVARFHIDRARLEQAGHLEKGKVYIHDVDTPGQFDGEINAATAVEVLRRCRRFPSIARFEHERRAKWQITQEFVQKNENRNNCIVALCSAGALAGHSVLLLVGGIEHGTGLVERLPGAAIVHSKLGKKLRGSLISAFRGGEQKILAATSLADEGLDVPRASVLILAAGGRAAGKLEQRAGRVLRPFQDKRGGTIHDFRDLGATFSAAQSAARMRVYDRLGYEPEIVGYK